MIDHDAVSAAQRDDRTLSNAELLAAYERGSEELRAAVAGMSDGELLARPVPGKWSTLEVVCHIADCEQCYSDRIKRTLAMERPVLMGTDAYRYPAPLGYQQHDLDEELTLMELTRRETARVLRLVGPEAWERMAIHSETGLVSLRQLVLHAVRHLAHHLPLIAEKRTAMGPR